MAEACPKCGWQPVRRPGAVRAVESTSRDTSPSSPRARRVPRRSSARRRWPPAPSAPTAEARRGRLLDPRPRRPHRHRRHPRRAGGLYATGSMVFGNRSSMVIRVAAQAFGAMLVAVYPVFFHWRWGQTLGKMAVDIRVVTCRPTPRPPGGSRTAGRSRIGCAVAPPAGVRALVGHPRHRLPDGRAAARSARAARPHRGHPRRASPVNAARLPPAKSGTTREAGPRRL